MFKSIHYRFYRVKYHKSIVTWTETVQTMFYSIYSISMSKNPIEQNLIASLQYINFELLVFAVIVFFEKC